MARNPDYTYYTLGFPPNELQKRIKADADMCGINVQAIIMVRLAEWYGLTSSLIPAPAILSGMDTALADQAASRERNQESDRGQQAHTNALAALDAW
jgi:hypothetical protein